MNDLLSPLFNLLPAMWHKRWWGLAAAWVVAIVGLAGVSLYKARYEASATVYVDSQSTLRPLLQGLAVEPNVGDQVSMLARTLLSRANLDTVIDANHLLPPGASQAQREQLRQQLAKTVKVKISGGSASNNIYEVSYVSHDPARTLGVVNVLMALFVKHGLSTNQQDSRQALKFIDSQIALYSGKLQDMETRLREFRSDHPGYSVPGANNLAAQQGQLQDQVITLQAQLAAATSSRDALQGQLASVRPTLSPDLVPGMMGGQAAQPSAIDQRIVVLRNRLSDLLQRYTDAYPDVIATRQSLAQLEAERAREQRQAANHPAAAHDYSDATNPVYQQLRVSLAQSNANVASLQTQLSELHARLQQLEQRERQMPGLDERYVQLTRNFGVLNDTYQKLMQRREAAMLSLNQEDSRRKDYFHVVDPPRLAPSPLPPHRSLLVAAVLLLSLAAGLGTAYAYVLLLPTYHTARQLRETSERPVLGAISLVMTPARVARERRDQGLFWFGSGALVLLFAGWAVLSVLHLFH